MLCHFRTSHRRKAKLQRSNAAYREGIYEIKSSSLDLLERRIRPWTRYVLSVLNSLYKKVNSYDTLHKNLPLKRDLL